VQEMILRRYASSPRFFVDIVSSFPYDVLGGVLGGFSIMRIPHILRVCLLPRYFTDLKQHLEDSKKVIVTSEVMSTLLMAVSTAIFATWAR
jgi:hypothetical protein